MKINDALFQARFLRRLNRFRIKVQMKNTEDAYLPNPGRMKELLQPQVKLLLLKKKVPSRKTSYDATAVRHNKIWVCIDSRIPNKFVSIEIAGRRIREFASYYSIQPEFRLNHSRIDFLLRGEGECLLEVKGCTLVKEGLALFPDAPTERGARHLRELMKAKNQGYRTCMLFIVQRPDADRFSPNARTDPEFADTLKEAVDYGVEVIAYTSSFARNSITLGRRIPIQFKPAENDP